MMITATLPHRNQNPSLQNECEFFYYLMFKRPVPRAVLEHYISAHQHLAHFILDVECEQATIVKILKKRLDAVCIESCLRAKKNNHLLCIKIAFISYIAEVDAQHPEYQRNKNERWPLLSLAWIGVVAITQLLYGLYLVRRHGLV